MTPVAIVLALGAGVVLLVVAVLASQRNHEVSGRVGAYNVYAKDELGATYILLMPRRGEGNLWPT